MSRCEFTNKHGTQCGNAAARKCLCLYHQVEERTRRLLAKLERNEVQRQAIVQELRKLP